jgi:hypothetical protein
MGTIGTGNAGKAVESCGKRFCSLWLSSTAVDTIE